VVGPTAGLNGSVSSGDWSVAGGWPGYEAHDRLLGRIVAIKVLALALDRVRGFVKRFRRRARAAAHPN
jgi:hypothetical protein